MKSANIAAALTIKQVNTSPLDLREILIWHLSRLVTITTIIQKTRQMPPQALAAVVVTHVMLRILVATITVIMVAAIAIAVTELVALRLAAKFVLKVCATA